MFSIDIKEAEPTTPYIRDMASGEWLVRLPDMKTAWAVLGLISAERDACAKIAEREVWVRSGGVAARNVAKAIRTGKSDVSDAEMVGFTSHEPD